MSKPVVAFLGGGSRVKFAITLLCLGIVFALGSLTLHPRHVSRTLGVLAMIPSVIGGTVPMLGSRRLATQRWLVLVSLATLAAMFGLLAQMLLHALVAGPG